MTGLWATGVNALAIGVGAGLGIRLHHHLSARLVSLLFDALGLLTLGLGLGMAIQGQQGLVLILSLVLGAILGETLDLAGRVETWATQAQKTLGSHNPRFVQGLVSSTLLFCVGAMAILGSLEAGRGQFPRILLQKTLLDGLAALALASGLGEGVIWAAIPLATYQGSLTMLAGWSRDWLNPRVVAEISAVGGLLLMGTGLDLLALKAIRVVNLLPALVIAGLLASLPFSGL